MDTVTMAFAKVMKWLCGAAAMFSMVMLCLLPVVCLAAAILWLGAVTSEHGSTAGLLEYKAKAATIPWWFWACLLTGFFTKLFVNIGGFFTRMSEQAWQRQHAKNTQ